MVSIEVSRYYTYARFNRSTIFSMNAWPFYTTTLFQRMHCMHYTKHFHRFESNYSRFIPKSRGKTGQPDQWRRQQCCGVALRFSTDRYLYVVYSRCVQYVTVRRHATRYNETAARLRDVRYAAFVHTRSSKLCVSFCQKKYCIHFKTTF